MNAEPVAPRLLNPSVPRDLETICLKCLNKEPSARYESGAALAGELDCWLAGKPILARPAGRTEKVWRWCRRKPAIASLAASVFILLLTVAIGSTLVALRLKRANTQ